MTLYSLTLAFSSAFSCPSPSSGVATSIAVPSSSSAGGGASADASVDGGDVASSSIACSCSPAQHQSARHETNVQIMTNEGLETHGARMKHQRRRTVMSVRVVIVLVPAADAAVSAAGRRRHAQRHLPRHTYTQIITVVHESGWPTRAVCHHDPQAGRLHYIGLDVCHVA